MARRIAVAVGLAIGLAAVLGLVLLVAAGKGLLGRHEGAGTPAPTSAAQLRQVAARSRVQHAAALAIGVPHPEQILFGDLHVHTTFSLDAFLFSLPVLAGEGAHPPADACDFARFCSALDFWSINDHAFSITPEHWRETVEAIRQCNAMGGPSERPGTVAFLGWEWTQVGTTPEDHYGHKNVVLADLDDAHIPARPIAALRSSGLGAGLPGHLGRGAMALLGGSRTRDLVRYLSEWEATPRCPEGVDVHDLPRDCIEGAATPADLFRKLDEWGVRALVIPHGTTWGFYSPPGSSWDKQLAGDMHDPDRQKLIEIYSGHGDSEVYRSWRAVRFAADGTPECPEPTPDYLPSCWRAGEIIRERCEAAGESDAECEHRAEVARRNAAAAGVAVHRTVPGARAEDWLDAGQCRDCREPAFNYRPASSAQYILTLGNFDDDPADPRRFHMGFLGSSDNHFARPGTGYKEVNRIGFTESMGGTPGAAQGAARLLAPPSEEPVAESRPFHTEQPGFQMFETERVASFLNTGGLVAVHATGRDRAAIWDALERRDVYGTTGPRILLWFDLLNPPGSRGRVLPMGSDVEMSANPIFQVRAVGSFEQRPGCPDEVSQALGPEEVERICRGECYNPGDRRRRITRIEVVRIRPQMRPHEDPASLIDDPWRVFPCEPDPSGCAVTFEDPDFASTGRDSLYYVRAFEAETLGINAGRLRCDRDEEGNCLRTHPCPGPEGAGDECLAPYEPRAWSSPIFVDHAGRLEEPAAESAAP